MSCITACGTCAYCLRGRFGQCTGGGGWRLGHTLDGVQAEVARVPFADTSTHLVPAGVSIEQALMFADIVPTSYEVGALAGHVTPGDTVVIVGAGPIGLAAIATSRLFSPARVIVVEAADARLAVAKAHGADIVLDSRTDDVPAAIRELTGDGAEVVIEAVGLPATFELCTEVVRPTGHLANIGVHGTAVSLPLERLWAQDVTITTGLVDTSSTPRLLRLVAAGLIDVDPLISHRFTLDELPAAYDVFAHAENHHALKVVASRP